MMHLTQNELIPIVVTCVNRLRFLDITLKGLSATVPSMVPVYISNDGTKNSNMIDYLRSSNIIELTDDSFPDSPFWVKQMGMIPNYRYVTGIANKARIIIHPHSKGIKNFTDVIRIAFEENNCHNVIKIQDDVVFKQGWYQKICRAVQNQRFGLISGFRHFFGNARFETDGVLDEIISGYVGGIMLVISRTVCKRNSILWENDLVKKRDMDDFWVDGCRQAGMAVGVLRKSICQHIGFKSEVYRPNERHMLHGNTILRCDRDLFPPFEIANHVKKFG